MIKFMLVLAVALFLGTTLLLVNIAAIGQAPVAMYFFVGGIGYCVSITAAIAAIMASFLE